MKQAISALLGIVILMSVLCILPSAETGEEPIVNLYRKENAFAGFVNGWNEEKPHAAHYTTEHIAVQAGDVITFGPCDSKQDFYLHGFDANGNISDSTVRIDRLTNSGTLGEKYCILSYTVPQHVATVRIANASAINDIFLVTKNRVFTPFEFGKYWDLGGDNSYTNRFGAYFEVKTNGVLFGKSALFVGDSISCGSQENSLFYRAWAGRIGIVNQMDYVNASVSGASCSTTRPNNRILTQLKENSGRSFDYVILHGGVNDAWDSRRVGTPTKDFRPLFDNSNFAGGLEEMIQYAVTNFPGARIGYIINYKAPGCKIGKIADMGEYVAVAKKICEKWGVSYLNLYEDDDFCFNTLNVNSQDNLPDFIHPNARGYDLLYPVIEAWMETLTPYQMPEEKPFETPTSSKNDTPPVPTDTVSEAISDTGDSSNASGAGCRSVLASRWGILPILTLASSAAFRALRRRKKQNEIAAQIRKSSRRLPIS